MKLSRLRTDLNVIDITPLSAGEISDLFNFNIGYNSYTYNANGVSYSSNFLNDQINNNFLYKVNCTSNINLQSGDIFVGKVELGTASDVDKYLGLYVVEEQTKFISNTRSNLSNAYLVRAYSYDDILPTLLDVEASRIAAKIDSVANTSSANFNHSNYLSSYIFNDGTNVVSFTIDGGETT